MEYTLEYFISKFEAIHSEYWINEMHGKNNQFTCALGFCGGYTDSSKESKSLAIILSKFYTIINKEVPKSGGYIDLDAVVYFLNDDAYTINLPTSKERILHALHTIRDKELSQANVREVEKIINTVGEPLNV